MITAVRVAASTGVAKITLLKRTASRKADGYDNLIEGIVDRARKDLFGNNFDLKIDAMDFYRSAWFEFLTGLDGEEILQKLLK